MPNARDHGPRVGQSPNRLNIPRKGAMSTGSLSIEDRLSRLERDMVENMRVVERTFNNLPDPGNQQAVYQDSISFTPYNPGDVAQLQYTGSEYGVWDITATIEVTPSADTSLGLTDTSVGFSLQDADGVPTIIDQVNFSASDGSATVRASGIGKKPSAEGNVASTYIGPPFPGPPIADHLSVSILAVLLLHLTPN